MKRNFIQTKLAAFFLLPLVLLVVFAFGFVSGSAGTKIELPEAQELYKNNKEKVKAVYIDRETLADFNALLMSNTEAEGVRLYFGKNEEKESVNFTVAVTDGKDDVDLILRASGISDVCPKWCDAESPIVNQ